MKVIICILFLQVIISACQKENPNLGPYYHYLIGEWESIGQSDDRIRIKFDGKGRIKISVSTQRVINFHATSYRKGLNDTMTITYFKNNSSYELMVYHKANNNDTIEMGIFQNIENLTIDGGYTPTFVKVL